MRKIKIPKGASHVELRETVRQLKALEARWCDSGRRRDLFRYLDSVFQTFRLWKKWNTDLLAAQRLARRMGVTPQKRLHPIRVLIDATSKADRKSKSRWTQALRYAWRKHVDPNRLSTFLKSHGGIAGCASRWADMHAHERTPKGFVRHGGEDRVPKIPFFVHSSLLDQYGYWNQ
jgi:hypothetical protein